MKFNCNNRSHVLFQIHSLKQIFKLITLTYKKNVLCVRLNHYTYTFFRSLNSSLVSVWNHQVRIKLIPKIKFRTKGTGGENYDSFMFVRPLNLDPGSVWPSVKSGIFYVRICIDLWIKVTFRGHQKVESLSQINSIEIENNPYWGIYELQIFIEHNSAS